MIFQIKEGSRKLIRVQTRPWETDLRAEVFDAHTSLLPHHFLSFLQCNENSSEVGLLCTIPHAGYFCLAAFITSFSSLIFFPTGLRVCLCVLEAGVLSCHFPVFSVGTWKTLPGRVWIYIYARKHACKHQGRDRLTGCESLGHNKTQQQLHPETSLGHILNCLHSCQSSLAGAGCQCETLSWIQTWSRRSRELHHLSLAG